MAFNFKAFAEEYGIPIMEEGHKHCQPGWIQTTCPFCSGHDGYHLGFCLQDNFFHCWRCGWHSHTQIIMEFAKVDYRRSYAILSDFKGRPTPKPVLGAKVSQISVKWPIASNILNSDHRRYLETRKYDPDKIIADWGVMGTGNIGPYKNRIIAPIFHKGEWVSYQGRDITNKHPLKYKACSRDKEARHHKECLYGLDNVSGRSVLVTEGIFDVWRFGYGAVCTFGIKYTDAQILLLLDFERIRIIFDNEIQAQRQARRLAGSLLIHNKDVGIITLNTDPGDLEQDKALNLKEELLYG